MAVKLTTRRKAWTIQVVAPYSALLLAGCGTTPQPCLGATGCPASTECLAARCVDEGSAPVDPSTERVLLNPSGIAVAASSAPDAIGASVTFGNASSAPVALYLRFEQTWRAGPVDSAFLILEPSAGTVGGLDLEVEVGRADRSWTGPGFSWSERPGISPPFSRAVARSSPRMPVRIDVTELLRFFADHPAQDFGLVLRARSAGGAGVTLSTGVGGGPPPRLDVYLVRPKTAQRASTVR
jgi:hypothetical protein